jgi:hypothetical protein
MSLVLWRAPVVVEPDEAAQLLRPYYDHGDDSVFEPSDELGTIVDELLRRFPDQDDGPWAESPPRQADRVLHLEIRWGAADTVVDTIVELAREHGLVLYHPQGPDVFLPLDPVALGPVPAPRLRDYFRISFMGVAALAVVWLGWQIGVPVLNWLLMIVGGFFFSVVVFLLGIMMFGRRLIAGKESRRRHAT